MSDLEIVKVAEAALAYIDAIPKEVVAKLPAMPGFDRDWAEVVMADAEPNQALVLNLKRMTLLIETANPDAAWEQEAKAVMQATLSAFTPAGSKSHG